MADQMADIPEHPILFKGPMVRAILAGAKTQTRRIVKWRDLAAGLNLGFTGLQAYSYVPGLYTLESRSRDGWESRSGPTRCPYGQPGERLWVRETWARNQVMPLEHRAPGKFIYGADLNESGFRRYAATWKPSIHMPRAACRLVLEVAGVRVERLNAISEADALAEGIVRQPDDGYGLADSTHYHATDPRVSFLGLWEATNGDGSVAANPWVWVIDFRALANANNETGGGHGHAE